MASLFTQRSLSLVATFLLPFLSPVFCCSASYVLLVLLLPFARSALRPILAPFLVYFLLSALALPLGLLYFCFTETYLCPDTCQNVWFYLHRGSSRKFAEGRGGRRFLEQAIVDNPHIYIYIYIPLLLLKGTYHYWKYLYFSRGLNQMKAMIRSKFIPRSF